MRRYLEHPLFIGTIIFYVAIGLFIWPWIKEKREIVPIELPVNNVALPDTIWLNANKSLDNGSVYIKRKNKYTRFGEEPYVIVGDSIIFRIPVRFNYNTDNYEAVSKMLSKYHK